MQIVQSDDDGRRGADSHRRFTLGPVEVAMAACIPTLLLGLLVWLGASVMTRLDSAGEKMEAFGTAQAVTNSKLAGIEKQLEGLPAIAQQQAVNTAKHFIVEKRLDRLERLK